MKGEKILIEGCDNLRQLGGYKSADGRCVKAGQFYRGGALYCLKKPDAIQKFKQLGIKTVLDLRSAQERKTEPDPQIDGINNVAISALVAMDNTDINFDLSTLLLSGTSKLAVVSDFVATGYKEMPFNNPAYKAMFNMLLNDETPIMFHCTAGKDRTGIAAALILSALDVPFETIKQDFMLTNTVRADTIEKMIEKYSPILLKAEPTADARLIFSQIAGVCADNLQASFDEIYKKYKTFGDYLFAEFGIDEATRNVLKDKFLE